VNAGRPQLASQGRKPQEFRVGDSDTAWECFVGSVRWTLKGDTLSPKFWFVQQAAPDPLHESGEAKPPDQLAQGQQGTIQLQVYSELPGFDVWLNAPRGPGVSWEAPAEAGTRGVQPDRSQEELEQYVRGVLEAAREEYFADGMESSVSRELVPVVERHHKQIAEFLFYWLAGEKGDPEVTAEALHWLGLMDHAPSRHWRRRLLERCLEASSLTVRDAAGIGLAAMDDPQAVPSVNAAIERESCAELRQLLERVLAQLEGRPGWRCF